MGPPYPVLILEEISTPHPIREGDMEQGIQAAPSGNGLGCGVAKSPFIHRNYEVYWSKYYPCQALYVALAPALYNTISSVKF